MNPATGVNVDKTGFKKLDLSLSLSESVNPHLDIINIILICISSILQG